MKHKLTDTNDSPLNCIPRNEWDALILSILTPLFSLCNRDALINPEDLQQEAWISLLVACERYDSTKAKVTTFAYHYIRGSVMRYITKATRNKPNQIDKDARLLDTRTCEDVTVEQQDFMKIVFSLVSDQKHVELLHEHFLKDKSFRQIARETNSSHASIANRVHDLLDTLEIRLGHENA